MQERSIFSTYPWPDPAWRERVDVVDAPAGSHARMSAVLHAARSHRVLVLNGFAKADLAATAMLARRRRRPQVLLLDLTWKTGSSLPDRVLTRTVVRLLDRDTVHYGVLSAFEVDTFPRTWGVAPERLHQVLWFCTLPDDVLAAPPRNGGGVFAGGSSLRDWDLMLAAARDVPGMITIASGTLTPQQLASVPPHATAGPVDPRRYDELLLAADVVVVPMEARPDRSSGQGTFLAAMALGKALVVNDAPGVRDYVDDGVTGVVVPRQDPKALAAALRELLADPERRARLGAAAKEEVRRRFLRPHYVERVLATVDALPD